MLPSNAPVFALETVGADGLSTSAFARPTPALNTVQTPALMMMETSINGLRRRLDILEEMQVQQHERLEALRRGLVTFLQRTNPGQPIDTLGE